MSNYQHAALTGGCQCGEIRYESKGNPLALYICHCRECQKQSSSAFGISLDVLCAGFSVTQGVPKYWSRPTNSGQKLRCAFCSNCGSRLWHEDESGVTVETLSIKGGSLDKPLDISNAIHVWCASKLKGIIIPDNAKQYLEEPDDLL